MSNGILAQGTIIGSDAYSMVNYYNSQNSNFRIFGFGYDGDNFYFIYGSAISYNCSYAYSSDGMNWIFPIRNLNNYLSSSSTFFHKMPYVKGGGGVSLLAHAINSGVSNYDISNSRVDIYSGVNLNSAGNNYNDVFNVGTDIYVLINSAAHIKTTDL